MAKKVQDAGIRQIIDDIRKGNLAPVYLLHGEEAYYIDMISDNIERYAVPEDERDFNTDIFYGSDADIAYVVATAQQFPTMAARRLVMLKEAQGMTQAKNQLDKLAPYCERPNPSAVLVISYKGEPFSAASKLVKSVKSGGGVVFRSDVPAEWQLEAHVRDYVTQRRVNIEDKALKMVVDYVGAPLSKLFGELGKLVAIKGAGVRITCDDVEKNIGMSKDFTTFELADAIAMKDYPKAMKIVKYLEGNPKTDKMSPLMSVASTLFNYFANLVTAYYLPDRSDAALMSELGFKAQVQLRNLKTGMRNYSAAQSVNAIHYIRDYDAKSKGIDSMQRDVDLLDELIFKIFT